MISPAGQQDNAACGVENKPGERRGEEEARCYCSQKGHHSDQSERQQCWPGRKTEAWIGVPALEVEQVVGFWADFEGRAKIFLDILDVRYKRKREVQNALRFLV